MALTDENGGGIPATMLVSPSNFGGGAPYPVYMNGQGNSNGGWGDGGWWIVLLIIVIAALGGNWGGIGNNGGFAGAGAPVVITDNNGGSVQRGFDQAAVMAGVGSIQNGINNLATQLCGCCGDIQTSLCNGFAGVNSAVTGAQNAISQQLYGNTIADLERSFAAQTANTQGMNAIQSQLAQCCCDNRLATNDLKYTIATENCADRAALSDGIRDILTANSNNTQRILDQLCADKIDAKNEKIADLERQLTMANLNASQIAQTAQIQRGQTAEVDALYQRLRDCPVPTMPVYGMTPIFTCPNNNGCGCGCNNGNF